MALDTRFVTVLVPAFNSAETLPRAVRSALAQDVTDLELVIINDGSVDRTADVAHELARADNRVRLLNLVRNRGKPYAMNTGMAEARGRWVAVLDADDWYAPDRLGVLLSAAEQMQVQLVADNQFLYDEGAEQIVRTAFPAHSGDHALDKSAFVTGSDPYSEFDFGMLKPIIRSDFARASDLRYHENAKLSEDFLYLLEFLAAGGQGWLVARPMYYWCQAFGSISRRWTETGAGKWRYDFLSAAAANGEVLRAMQRAGETELAALLERRMRAFQRLHWFQEVHRMKACGAAPSKLAREILSHPSIWPLVASRGIRRVARTLPIRLSRA